MTVEATRILRLMDTLKHRGGLDHAKERQQQECAH